MIYQFTDAVGEIRELNYSMKDVPSIGDVVFIDGEQFTRIASSIQVDPATCRSQYPYVSQCLPRNLKGCKTDRTGHPVVQSRRHEKNIMSEHGYAKD
jgi:hypothetical protein